MAISRCPKCEGLHFEMVEHTPNNSKYILHFVQCAACGCVVGVLEYFNIGYLIQKILKHLRIT